jgi:hypothetical protein
VADDGPFTRADFEVEIKKLSDEISGKIDALKRHVDETPTTLADHFYRFFSSGIFFIVFGIALLIFAQSKLVTTHAALTFVLVVLGTAIVLYGTGTQSIGRFESAGYKVAIAGGAGVLALVIGYGMIKEHQEMRNVFRPHKDYLILRIHAQGGANGDLRNYTGTFEMDGALLPAFNKDSYIVVLVPRVNELQQRSLSYLLRRHTGANAEVEDAPEGNIALLFGPDAADDRTSGFDFPFYCKKGTVKSTESCIYEININKKNSPALNTAGQAAQQINQQKLEKTISPTAAPPTKVAPKENEI